MKKTIFVVDDIAMNLSAIKIILKDAYEVFTMTSAEKLFAMLGKVTPDLILLDIVMPEVDGFAVIKLLKANALYANIPVIFFTATIDEKEREQAFALGAADYIEKPLSLAVLTESINKHLA